MNDSGQMPGLLNKGLTCSWQLMELPSAVSEIFVGPISLFQNFCSITQAYKDRH